MMARNQGMLGRFRRTLDFEDWTAESCVALLTEKAKDSSVALAGDACGRLHSGFEELIVLPGWACAWPI